jgi:hypothetical protein
MKGNYGPLKTNTLNKKELWSFRNKRIEWKGTNVPQRQRIEWEGTMVRQRQTHWTRRNYGPSDTNALNEKKLRQTHWMRRSYGPSDTNASNKKELWSLRDKRIEWEGTMVPQRQTHWMRRNVKLIRYQFWCTRCAFRLIKSRQWYSGRKSWNPKNCKTCKKAEKTKYCPWNWAKSVEG